MDEDPVDRMEACAHSEACLRQLGRWCCGGEMDRERMFWMDDAARGMGCAGCEEFEGDE